MNYLYYKNKKITVDSILHESTDIISEFPKIEYIIHFINRWKKGENNYQFTTSGSTGQPKRVSLHRSNLAYSAQQTLINLDLTSKNGLALLCLPYHMIGGTMMIVRALISDLDLEVVDPSTVFTTHHEEYMLAAMVPIQADALKNRLKVKNLLIGGAEINAALETSLRQHTTFENAYHTYGMTETASHVALRKIGRDFFETIGDLEIDQDHRDCLKIRGTVTQNHWLQTNDIVKLADHSSFEWLGRSDFVINSGGIKVSPEKIEKLISEQYPGLTLMVTSITDAKLGNKLVLACEKEEYESVDLEKISFENRHHRPKEIIILDRFAYTNSGKIDRLATQNKVEQLLT